MSNKEIIKKYNKEQKHLYKYKKVIKQKMSIK